MHFILTTLFRITKVMAGSMLYMATEKLADVSFAPSSRSYDRGRVY